MNSQAQVEAWTMTMNPMTIYQTHFHQPKPSDQVFSYPSPLTHILRSSQSVTKFDFIFKIPLRFQRSKQFVSVSQVCSFFIRFSVFRFLFSKCSGVGICIHYGIHFGYFGVDDIAFVQTIAKLSIRNAGAIEREKIFKTRERLWPRAPHWGWSCLGATAVCIAYARVSNYPSNNSKATTTPPQICNTVN